MGNFSPNALEIANDKNRIPNKRLITTNIFSNKRNLEIERNANCFSLFNSLIKLVMLLAFEYKK